MVEIRSTLCTVLPFVSATSRNHWCALQIQPNMREAVGVEGLFIQLMITKICLSRKKNKKQTIIFSEKNKTQIVNSTSKNSRKNKKQDQSQNHGVSCSQKQVQYTLNCYFNLTDHKWLPAMCYTRTYQTISVSLLCLKAL